jgi:hypothetical protein
MVGLYDRLVNYRVTVPVGGLLETQIARKRERVQLQTGLDVDGMLESGLGRQNAIFLFCFFISPFRTYHTIFISITRNRMCTTLDQMEFDVEV